MLMDRTLSNEDCHTPDRCSRLAENRALIGGAVRIRGDLAEVDIRQTWIEANRSQQSGSAVHIGFPQGEPSPPTDRARLSMEGNMLLGNIADNSDSFTDGLIDIQPNSNVRVAFSTIAGNNNDSGQVNFLFFGPSDFRLYSSVLDESIGSPASGTWLQ